MKELNVCVVGCGGMARFYLHRYTEVPGVKLALVIDVNESVAQAAAEKFPGARWSTSFEDALADDIDIVDVSTPNHLHASQTVAALKAGKHVLVQKPIAPLVEEAEEMVRVANESGLYAGMYMNMLDNPLYQELRTMIRQGHLGTVTGVHARMAHRGGLQLTADSWRKSAQKTGGGSFIQLSLHDLHLTQWMLDSTIRQVAAFSQNRLCKSMEGDDVTSAICQFADGTTGTFESSYCSDGRQISVYGTKGTVSVLEDAKVKLQLDAPYAGDWIRYENPGQEVVLDAGFTAQSLFSQNNPFDQHAAYLQAILNGTDIPSPLEEGLRDLRLVQEIYRSAREGQFITLA